MTGYAAHKVERWFADNARQLSQLFPELHFHVQHATDEIKGSATIQANGPLAGASITFWNKGDVAALVLDKINAKEYTFDDRVLTAEDSVGSLLDTYAEKLASLIDALEKRK